MHKVLIETLREEVKTGVVVKKDCQNKWIIFEYVFLQHSNANYKANDKSFKVSCSKIRLSIETLIKNLF